ncbi:hypothetical protein Daus18300_014538 [Diaporthe australafricana]|uniref:Uncharacterized protein n=1 Tax=Diaporthe australafricana TaxID=127596 RepID=A0ABR3VUU6_9PEZI
MGESSKIMSFTSVPKENDALTADIRDFIRDSGLCLESRKGRVEEARGRLEELLERLYVHICRFGSYEGSAATPDKKILAAWQSFLGPINVLAGVKPNGQMIAARRVGVGHARREIRRSTRGILSLTRLAMMSLRVSVCSCGRTSAQTARFESLTVIIWKTRTPEKRMAETALLSADRDSSSWTLGRSPDAT